MEDDVEVAAENRSYARRFPFLMAGALAILLGLGFVGAGLHYWPWTAGVVAVGVLLIAVGEWRGRHVSRS